MTAMLLVSGLPANEYLFPPGASRDMYIVAHQDDDLLFMNPDIQTSIALGHIVRTVYMTAGDACQGPHFWRDRREAGVMAAYAQMAAVANSWIVRSTRILEVVLQDKPTVGLVFLRIPASFNELGADCPNGRRANLRTLWIGASEKVTALDGSQSYTRAQLIEVLADLIARFRPHRLSTLDSSGLTPDGCKRGDPSAVRLEYPRGRRYIYDHSEHYHSGLFALAARQQYTRPTEFRRYRGYNVANEAANVTGDCLQRKYDTFMTYANYDSSVLVDGRLGGFYSEWLSRQYLQQAAAVDR